MITARQAAVRAGLALLLALAAHRAPAASRLPVAAERGMVVTGHRLASEVGVAVLARGGNAVDAAVAVGYALAVTLPAAGNLGGGGFMLVRFADGRSTFLDFRERAPGAARADMYLDARGAVVPNLSTRGYLAAGIPGTVAGLELARAKYGTRPRAELMAPAIRLAREGFILDHGDIEMLTDATLDFRKDPPSARIFLKNGQPYAPGQRLVQRDLAWSLETIARGGADAFYRGPVARRIVAAARAHGGIMTEADFAGYAAREWRPLTCDYRGWRIQSAPPPSSGGMVICESLNILEGYPMAALGFHGAQGTHYWIEALRRAFHDRNMNLGDPSFVTIDLAHFLDKGYAASLRDAIARDRATPSADLPGPTPDAEGSSTTHVSIVDAEGNAVALTYTLNDWFGARVTPEGTGILLNDEMDDFAIKPGHANMYGLVEGTANAIAPGKRPLSAMSPTIITRDGRLAMVIGTPGGSRIPTSVLQVIMNVVDYGMQVQEAVDAPRIHHQWLPDVTDYEPNALSPDTIALLEAKGQTLRPKAYRSHVAAILVGAPGLGLPPIGRNRLYGAIDPRLNLGAAVGY